MTEAKTPSYDVAILTVLPVELQAVMAALKIDSRQRIRKNSGIYFSAVVYSRLLDLDLSVIVGCIGEASQSSAALATTHLITLFRPAFVVLVGIAAGIRNKLKIGDVIVPREVVDVSLSVQQKDETRFRPQTHSCHKSVKQMLPSFNINEAAFHARCRDLFGPPITPSLGQEGDFAQNVTFEPIALDNAIATSDRLLKNKHEFEKLQEIHDSIRAAEMEAGGLIKACNEEQPSLPWLVVRGISDFGDDLKNDNFHRLASCAAAAWVSYFLEDGFDLLVLRDKSLVRGGEGFGVNPSSAETPTARSTQLAPVTINVLNDSLDKLTKSSCSDRLKDLEDIREKWRIEPGRPILNLVQALKQRADWPLLENSIKAKVLRFEASLVLAVDRNIAFAKELASQAANLVPTDSMKTLNALIFYHENGASSLAGLSNPNTQESWNLRLNLIFETDQWPQLLTETSAPPPNCRIDAEVRRLRALALLNLNHLKDADAELRPALSDHPQWFNLRYVSAILAYFSCQSEPLFLKANKKWPEPSDLSFIKRDRASIDALRYAEDIFRSLLTINGLDSVTRIQLQGWKLACLANDPERQNDAQNYCAMLLSENPNHEVALSWAILRDFPIDLDATVKALTTTSAQAI